MELEVFKSINSIMSDLSKEGISKDRCNAQQGYAFRGIDDIYNTLSSLISKHNLCIIPFCEERNSTERATLKGGVIFYTTVRMRYRLISSIDGSQVECCTVGEAMDSADKSTNKAMSAAYKYLCLQIFCIPTEGDNDADATTPPQLTGRSDFEKDATSQKRAFNKAVKDGATTAPEIQTPLSERANKCLDWLNSLTAKQFAAKANSAKDSAHDLRDACLSASVPELTDIGLRIAKKLKEFEPDIDDTIPY